jgi:hypothetical protein
LLDVWLGRFERESMRVIDRRARRDDRENEQRQEEESGAASGWKRRTHCRVY